MRIRFTESIRTAINFVLVFASGRLEGDGGLPKPCWGHFFFFNSVEGSKVERENTDSWPKAHLSREVRFYNNGNLVAVVWLRGIAFDNTTDNGCHWIVTRVKYATNVLTEPGQWHESDVPVSFSQVPWQVPYTPESFRKMESRPYGHNAGNLM